MSCLVKRFDSIPASFLRPSVHWGFSRKRPAMISPFRWSFVRNSNETNSAVASNDCLRPNWLSLRLVATPKDFDAATVATRIRLGRWNSIRSCTPMGFVGWRMYQLGGSYHSAICLLTRGRSGPFHGGWSTHILWCQRRRVCRSLILSLDRDFRRCSSESCICQGTCGTSYKRLSIPRLELQAAVLGTRIAEFIKRETRRQIAKCSFWTDSKNVLAWIKSTDQRFQTSVANRLAEIHDVTTPSDWFHIPSTINPADQPSRGQKLTQLSTEGEWLNGPDFLRKERSAWPANNCKSNEEVMMISDGPDLSEAMPDIRRFSRWTVAVRTVALIRRVRHWKDMKGQFTAEQMEAAENQWIRQVQACEEGHCFGHVHNKLWGAGMLDITETSLSIFTWQLFYSHLTPAPFSFLHLFCSHSSPVRPV